MLKGMIKKKIKEALRELYEEYIKDGEVSIVPDFENKGVIVKWSNKK